MTTPSTYAVRHTAVQCDTELYLPSGSQLLADTQAITPAELALQAGQTATATEVNKLAGVTGGTVTASKGVVVDASKDIGDFRIVRAARVITGEGALTAINTAGAVTYTIAQLLTGCIVRDPNGAGRTDVLPTAALLVAGIAGCKIGDVIRCKLVNGADAAEVITLDAGSGGAYDAVQTATARVLPQFGSKDIHIRVTGITALSESYVVAF